MTAAEFRERLFLLGVTQEGFAKMAGVSERSVRHWVSGANAVPDWASLILQLLPYAPTQFRRAAPTAPASQARG